MSKAMKSPRWFGSWRKTAGSQAGDAADYGTAFGLDMSLADVMATDDPRPKETGQAPKSGWMRRLGARPKSMA
jgi:hypothetical protein